MPFCPLLCAFFCFFGLEKSKKSLDFFVTLERKYVGISSAGGLLLDDGGVIVVVVVVVASKKKFQ